MFSSISTILDIIIFVLSGFIVSSTVAAVVFVVWTFGKMNERSNTKELLDTINSSSKKTNTSLAIIESYGLSVSGNKTVNYVPDTPARDDFNKIRTHSSSRDHSSIPVNSNEKMLLQTGHIHMKHGDFSSAIQDYTNAIIVNPNFAGAYNARGMANRKKRDFHAALQDYNIALSLHNNLAATYNNRGVIYMEIRQIEAALNDFDKALSIEPNNSYGYCNRAVAYNYMRDFNKSISESTLAVEINPQLPEAYVVRGIAKVQMGAVSAADLDFEVAESLGYKRIDIEERLVALKKV